MDMTFDSLRFAQTLRDKAKLSPEQAEGISEAFFAVSRDDLATKAELQLEIGILRSELKQESAAIRSEMKQECTAIRSEMKQESATIRSELQKETTTLRGEILLVRNDVNILKWMTGFLMTMQLAIFLKLFLK
jgi:hypothetical protein